MTTPGAPLPVAPGLLERFRAAGHEIDWRPAPDGPSTGLRVAHLYQEEAQVELVEGPGGCRCAVDAGPVGALVLLLEADRRGPPVHLTSREAERDPRFEGGSIVAVWGDAPRPEGDRVPRFGDLVDLARYALP